MPITGHPLTIATFRTLPSQNVDLVSIQIDTWQIPRAGIYQVIASLTYSNARAAGGGVRYVESVIKHGANFAAAAVVVSSTQELVNIGAGTEYASTTLNWIGSLSQGTWLFLGAVTTVANRIRLHGTLSASHWTVHLLHTRMV